MYTLKVTTVGSSLGVILPKELLSELNVAKGDQLYLLKSSDGLRLTALDPDAALQIEIGRSFMKEYRDAFDALAK